MIEIVEEIGPGLTLVRDSHIGIAWVKNTNVGIGHTCHPNISETGSVKGMVDRGFWNKSDKVVRSHGFFYNISICFCSDEFDDLARRHCLCGGKH